MEPGALKRPVFIALGVLLVLGAGYVAWQRLGRGDAYARAAEAPSTFDPAARRIRVEVINATNTRGLARRATFFLRDAGFDVVRFTTDTVQRDSTLVLDRSGHPDWAARVAKAMGGARVVARPDSLRYLDVSVFVGADWRPPSKPFYP